MIKVQSPNWRKIVRRLKMIDLRSNTHGCELINIINNYLYLLNDHSSFKNPRTHLLAPFYVKIALFLINAP